LQLDQLALGVSYDALTIAPELRIVRREQGQPCERSLPEGLNDRLVPEIRLDFPVGGDWSQVNDPCVPPWRLWFDLIFDFVGHSGLVS
jgi:hypothetical protein